jgi:hypothetical protein
MPKLRMIFSLALPVETCQPADDRLVVGKRTVAVKLLEIGEQRLDIIQRVRALRMTRHLRYLPWRQLAIHVLGQCLALFRQARDLVRDIQGRIVLHVPQLLDLVFQFRYGTFKIQE